MILRELLRIHAKDQTQPQAIQDTCCGLPVTIEFPVGSTRLIHNVEGDVVYRKFISYPYGFITKGRDGDEVDCIIGPIKNCSEIFVAHMLDKGPDVDEREDEDKVLIGFSNYAQALQAFHSLYPLNFFGGMTVLPIQTFKNKLASSPKKMLHARWSR